MESTRKASSASEYTKRDGNHAGDTNTLSAFDAVVSLGLRADGFISANAPLLGELLGELPFVHRHRQGSKH